MLDIFMLLQRIEEARNRAQTIAGETRDRLNAEAATQRQNLDAGLNAKLADAERQIAATKSAAMGNVRGIAIDAAAAIVQRLTGAPSSDAVVAGAVDAVLKR